MVISIICIFYRLSLNKIQGWFNASIVVGKYYNSKYPQRGNISLPFCIHSTTIVTVHTLHYLFLMIGRGGSFTHYFNNVFKIAGNIISRI